MQNAEARLRRTRLRHSQQPPRGPPGHSGLSSPASASLCQRPWPSSLIPGKERSPAGSLLRPGCLGLHAPGERVHSSPPVPPTLGRPQCPCMFDAHSIPPLASPTEVAGRGAGAGRTRREAAHRACPGALALPTSLFPLLFQSTSSGCRKPCPRAEDSSKSLSPSWWVVEPHSGPGHPQPHSAAHRVTPQADCTYPTDLNVLRSLLLPRRLPHCLRHPLSLHIHCSSRVSHVQSVPTPRLGFHSGVAPSEDLPDHPTSLPRPFSHLFGIVFPAL